ncbi:MAG: hypothetical protein K2N85_10895 [Lachnospiraceae bacterium]|nr:hypothetical protein [Lachnospiraceae bacterium]
MENKTHLNFADEKDYLTVLDYFGGEEHLKNNFPNILQMVHATKKCTSIYTRSSMSLVDERAFLHMSYEISDPKAGKVFYANAIHDKNKNYLEATQRVSGNLLNEIL